MYRIRVLRAETIQYVEKAYTQDSVQLFFAVIAGVSSLFAIWTSVLYGWAAGFFKRCEKKTKGKPKEKVEGIEIPSVQGMDKNKLHQLVKELVAIEMAKQTVDATEEITLEDDSRLALEEATHIEKHERFVTERSFNLGSYFIISDVQDTLVYEDGTRVIQETAISFGEPVERLGPTLGDLAKIGFSQSLKFEERITQEDGDNILDEKC